MTRMLAVLLAASAIAGCGPSAGACVTGLSTSCTPLYAPTFDDVFTNTLHPTCGQPGSSCHAAAGHMGGLVFDDADTAYSLLLGTSSGGNDGRARVVAGDPACSLLVERIESNDPSVQMPPGAPLSAAERCAIVQWIADGAKR